MDIQNSTLITPCWELYEQRIPKTHIAERLGKHQETIGIWTRAIEAYVLQDFLYKYQQAKKEKYLPIVKQRFTKQPRSMC